MSERPFGVDRHAPLRRLAGATQFSADSDLRDPVQVVRYLRGQPQLVELIEQGFGLRHDPSNPDSDPAVFELRRVGRPRVEGSWPLAFLAFMLTPGASILAWTDAQQSSRIWEECGFQTPPSYPTVHRAFVALEQSVNAQASNGTPQPDGFLRAARQLVRRARQFEPEVGRAVHVDGTASATRAAMVHCCPEDSACGRRQLAREERRRRAGKAPGAPAAAGHGTRLPQMPIQTVNEQRHKEASKPVNDQPTRDRELKRLTPEEASELGLAEGLVWWRQHDSRGEPHYFCCRDATVGARNYARGRGRGKFWVGWNAFKATDALFGAGLGVIVDRADRQEYHLHSELMEAVRESVGAWPQFMSADAGLAVKPVYEWNTSRGIGSALPWRRTRQHADRGDLEDHVVDRHGVPRCQYCGAEGKTRGSGLGFTITAHGTPVIRLRCRARLTADCARIQSVRCEHEPRLLQPLRLDDVVYNQLRQQHENSERVHVHDRQRYQVAGREVATRDHRIGVRWQLLRAHAAMFLDWFRLALRHGWFASLRRRTNRNEPAEVGHGDRLTAVLGARRKYQLALPYGPQAVAIGLGFRDPPWLTAPPKRTRRNGRLRS